MNARVAVDLELPPLATSAGEARRLLRDALAGVDTGDSLDAAQVAVSEIVTNALVHAGTPMRLRVLLGEGLRVELEDGSPHLPHQRDYSSIAATGRGLHMVSQMVDKWGAYPEGDGKVVWFEILEGEDGASAPGEVGPRASSTADSVEIELLNVPLLMHAAWQEHAAALLRELLLIRIDDDLEALEEHAGVSEALSILFEQIPAPELGEHPQEIMAAATEPGVSLARLVLDVPRSSLEHFQRLDDWLEEAVRIAEAGELLSPPTQPEVRIMRQWLCAEIREQSTGERPARAWVSPTDARAPELSGSVDWDPAEVDASPRLLLASDDTNRIVAVSEGALAALGHAERSAVVGERLVSIIPLRFHQAHIAGFTLHLVNGRSPLLGTRVTVPVVHSDGSEVDHEVTVEAVPLSMGRKVFIAEFFS